MSAAIKVNANAIDLEVKRATDAEGELSSQISVQANEIQLRVTSEEVDSIIEQKADSIRLKADKIAWESRYSSMTENGKLSCRDAYVSGTVFCGNEYGLWVKMNNSGKITGGYGSTQRGFIDYSALVKNITTGHTWEGVQVQGGVLRIAVHELAIKQTTDIEDVALTGATGDYPLAYAVDYKLDANGNLSDITWGLITLHFENGILTTRV